MKVTVRLHSYFVFLSKTEDGIVILDIEKSTNVKDLFQHFNIKREYVAAVTINKKLVQISESNLRENDLVEIFPVFGGG